VSGLGLRSRGCRAQADAVCHALPAIVLGLASLALSVLATKHRYPWYHERGGQRMSGPVTVCHRGASALAPENSLPAFQLAMEYGVDMVELDVHLSGDGQLVVTHDAEVRTRSGRVVDVGTLPAEELGRLDVSDAGGVPRLVDVFELVRGRMGVYVELKGARTGAALGALLRTGAAAGVELISGSAVLDLVAELREAAPEVPRSILFTPGWRLDEMIAACRELGASYAHPCFRPIEPAMVDAFHAARLRVMTPHTNDAAEARRFAAMGVDVIASDDPRILAALKREGRII